jgi:hypothetical protein
MVKELVRKDVPIALKPTMLILPGPVCQYLNERGITREDVLDMVREAHKPLGEGEK